MFIFILFNVSNANYFSYIQGLSIENYTKKMLCFLPSWGSHFRKNKKDISITPKIHGDKEHHKNIYEVFWTQMREHLI